MKKILTYILIAVMACFCLAGCGDSGEEAGSEGGAEGGISVVTTVFPVYDWTKNLTEGTDADVSMLLDSGVDLHSFQPSTEDIQKIAESDVFIYVGGESDEWVDDALENIKDKDVKVVDLMDILGDDAKEEEIVEGMEGEDEEGEEAEEEEGPEYDEHIWLSLKNASLLSGSIAEALEAADPDNKDAYAANAEKYKGELDSLDKEYEETVKSAKTKTLLFGDRFPFRYMTDDYGLDYYAAFIGCSAETEASFETIAFLADKVDELSLKYVMTIETSDGKIADSIINTTKTKDQKILTLDSMQSTTADDVKAGASYISKMKSNLEVLKEALN